MAPPLPSSPPSLLTLKRRLRIVAILLWGIVHDAFTLAKGLELNNQWSCIVGSGPDGVLDWRLLVDGPAAGLDEFGARVEASIFKITDFVRQVVFHRRDFTVRRWRNWVLEDPLVHPYRLASS